MEWEETIKHFSYFFLFLGAGIAIIAGVYQSTFNTSTAWIYLGLAIIALGGIWAKNGAAALFAIIFPTVIYSLATSHGFPVGKPAPWVLTYCIIVGVTASIAGAVFREIFTLKELYKQQASNCSWLTLLVGAALVTFTPYFWPAIMLILVSGIIAHNRHKIWVIPLLTGITLFIYDQSPKVVLKIDEFFLPLLYISATSGLGYLVGLAVKERKAIRKWLFRLNGNGNGNNNGSRPKAKAWKLFTLPTIHWPKIKLQN